MNMTVNQMTVDKMTVYEMTVFERKFYCDPTGKQMEYNHLYNFVIFV